MRIILIASSLALGLVLLALSPAAFLIAPLDGWIWRQATLASYLLLVALSPWVAPLALWIGTTAAYTAEGVLAAAGLGLATTAGVRLSARLSPGSRTVYLLLLIWSLGLPLIVLIAMEQWMCIS